MSDRMTLGVKCDDVLKDNGHWYALKARRKKMALVRIEVTNPRSQFGDDDAWCLGHFATGSGRRPTRHRWMAR